MLANPGAVLLLDEPDAHLEILRQRDVYNLLTDIAATHGSQIVAASHSEIVLQEAAERDVVIAFVGRPHRIDTRSRHQVKKALESIRMADYYLAARGAFSFDDAQPLVLKGIAQPIQARRLRGALAEARRGVPGLEAPMVGRDLELGMLAGLLEDVIANQRPRLVTIVTSPCSAARSAKVRPAMPLPRMR